MKTTKAETKAMLAEVDADFKAMAEWPTVLWLQSKVGSLCTTQVEDQLTGFINADGCESIHPELRQVLGEMVDAGRELARRAEAVSVLLNHAQGRLTAATARSREEKRRREVAAVAAMVGGSVDTVDTWAAFEALLGTKKP